MEDSILTKIRAEHRLILGGLKLTADAGNDLRKELYQIVRNEIVQHMAGEEASLYKNLEDLSSPYFHDHKILKEYLQHLNLLDERTEEWFQVFLKFKDLFMDHCLREERDLFREAKEDFSREELEDMVSDFEIVS